MAREIKLSSGYNMPIIGLGTWQSSPDDVEKAVETALSTGYRHIDTAYVYENEAAIGHVLKKWIDSGKIRREEIFIVTKLPPVGNRKASVEKYLKKSLEALQLAYVDLYLIHNPVGLQERGDEIWPKDGGKLLFDPHTDLVTLWEGMEDQVTAGRANSIGLSNFTAKQIKKIVKSAKIQPSNLQVELHLYFQQRELVAVSKCYDISVTAYAPLGSPGIGEWFKKQGMEAPKMAGSPLKDPTVDKIAKKYKKTPAQILLKHIMQKEIIVIPKSVTPSRIKENFQVLNFELTPQEMKELDFRDKRERLFTMPFFLGHHEYPFSDPY